MPNWIETNEGPFHTAAAIAPAVRSLLGQQNNNCLIRFVQSNQPENNDLEINGIEYPDIEQFYNALESAVGKAKKIEAVFVKGIGRFCLEIIETKAKSNRLKGKVALVTGGAQGFGEGIARELAADGAYIAIADLNFELAKEVVSSLCDQYGAGTASAFSVNVGDEDSVCKLMEDITMHFGGIDLLVSNAGVLKAGGLEEMTLKAFEFVTRINYTAFFLVTKYGSRPMKIQARFNPNYSSDIVQINSKSGLEGSLNNFAYAGSKFGGVGLVQSFAKELVGDRIKVNAICPGNYYEGPLWSDPEKGLLVQYLNAGKIPGAKTFDEVYDFYISKVPMRRGCSPADVACAIRYCVDQKYETGQAIPVTGGQIMLK